MKNFLLTLLGGILIHLAGCINLEVETFVGANGSGSSIIHYWTDVELLYQDTSSSNIYSFKDDIIRKNFEENSVEIKSIKVWENNADSTYHAEVKILFKDLNKLNRCNFFKDYKIEFKDGAPGQKIFNKTLKGGNFGIKNTENYTIKFIYHFPGTLITDNATEHRNNTLVWTFSLSQLQTDKTLTATIKIPDSSGYEYILPVLVLILLVLWLVLAIRNRAKRTEE